jgi:transposase
MDVCLLDQAGETRLHRHMNATPEALRKAIAPDRDPLVIAAEGLVTWDWLADFCAEHGMPCVLGHALSMKAIPGGKANNDKLDAQKIAVLRRGGLLPQASASPAELRAPRDLRRRRMPLARQRGELLAHGQHTPSQDTLPALGHTIADNAHRDGGAERVVDPAGPQSREIDRARIGDSAEWLRALDLPIVKAARPHDAHTLDLRRPVPGMGKILRLVWLDEMPAIERFPRGQDLASSCRLGKGAKASAGKRGGPAGTNIGHAPLPWAFSEAAVFVLRDHPAGQKCLTRLENKHSQGKALTILAHKLARAVSDLLNRKTAFARHTFLQASGRGVGELTASRDSRGMRLLINARQGVNTCVVQRS